MKNDLSSKKRLCAFRYYREYTMYYKRLRRLGIEVFIKQYVWNYSQNSGETFYRTFMYEVKSSIPIFFRLFNIKPGSTKHANKILHKKISQIKNPLYNNEHFV